MRRSYQADKRLRRLVQEGIRHATYLSVRRVLHNRGTSYSRGGLLRGLLADRERRGTIARSAKLGRVRA